MEQKRILLAENEPETARFIEDALKNLNLVVETVADGNEAWALLQTGDYAMLICDTELPNKDGWQLMRGIRATALVSDMPIVAVTDELPDKDYSTARVDYDLIFQKYPLPENGYDPISEIGYKVKRILTELGKSD